MKLLRRGVATRKAVGSRRSLSAHDDQSQQQHQQQHRHFGQEAQAEQGNVTRQNFWKSLDSFKAHLVSADFVSFDLELSGLHSFPPSDPSDLQLPLHGSYRLIKHLAEKFAVFQVGFSLFHLDPGCNRFLAHPYNFYVFPRNDLCLGLPATTFSCEASALDFLAYHGFDFNLCIQDGISYLSKTQEVEARTLLADEHSSFRLKRCTCSRSLRNISDTVFAERLRVDIKKWHANISSCSPASSFPGKDLAADFFSLSRGQIKDFKVPGHGVLSNCPSLTLRLENHHQVCLAQLVVEKHFKDLVPGVRSDCLSSSSHDIKLYFTKSKEHLDTVKSELERGCVQTRIKEAIGFRHVVDAIVSSRKPLIGHNCALDLAHIHSKFLSPLPSSVDEFSASLLANFPSIIDTECLMRIEPSLRASWARSRTSLNYIYSRMFKPASTVVSRIAKLTQDLDGQPYRAHVDIMASFRRYQDSDSNLLHEAGYDAFMTGCVFAQICQQLHMNAKDLSSAVRDHPNFANIVNFQRGMLDLRSGKYVETDGAKVSDHISASCHADGTPFHLLRSRH